MEEGQKMMNAVPGPSGSQLCRGSSQTSHPRGGVRSSASQRPSQWPKPGRIPEELWTEMHHALRVPWLYPPYMRRFPSNQGRVNEVKLLKAKCQYYGWGTPDFTDIYMSTSKQGVKCTLGNATTEGFAATKMFAQRMSAGNMLAFLERGDVRFTSSPVRSNLANVSEHTSPITAIASTSGINTVNSNNKSNQSIASTSGIKTVNSNNKSNQSIASTSGINTVNSNNKSNQSIASTSGINTVNSNNKSNQSIATTTICNSLKSKPLGNPKETPPNYAKVIDLHSSPEPPKTSTMHLEQEDLDFKFQGGMILNEVVQTFSHEEKKDTDYLLLMEKLSKEQKFALEYINCLDPIGWQSTLNLSANNFHLSSSQSAADIYSARVAATKQALFNIVMIVTK